MIPEVRGCLDSMDAVRGSIGQIIQGLDAQELNWNPLPGEANSLYAIVSHLCSWEQSVMHQRLVGSAVESNTEDALSATGNDPQVLLARLEEVGKATRELLELLTEADLDKVPNSEVRRPRSVRDWIYLHQRHLALHLGHMEITKQFYEAGVVTTR